MTPLSLSKSRKGTGHGFMRDMRTAVVSFRGSINSRNRDGKIQETSRDDRGDVFSPVGTLERQPELLGLDDFGESAFSSPS